MGKCPALLLLEAGIKWAGGLLRDVLAKAERSGKEQGQPSARDVGLRPLNAKREGRKGE